MSGGIQRGSECVLMYINLFHIGLNVSIYLLRYSIKLMKKVALFFTCLYVKMINH